MASTLAVRAMGERGRRVERRTLHFDLSHLDGSSEYTLHACLREHALEPHTRETLRQAREATPFLQEIPDHRLTHFAHLDLPSDAVALLTVTTAGGDGGQRLASMAIHVPKESYRAEQARARLGRPAVHPKLRALGLGGDPAPYPADIDDYKDATDAAVAFLFHHRDVMNLVASDDHGAAYVIQHHLEANPSLSDVATTILELGEAWQYWFPGAVILIAAAIFARVSRIRLAAAAEAETA